MRLLVDANLSPVVAARLREAGHDAIHVYDVGLAQAGDERIVEYALEHDYVIVSADTDFGAILARLDRSKPSFVLLRHVNEMTPEQHAALLQANLEALVEDLEAGAVAYAGTAAGTVVPISIATNTAGTPITLDSQVNVNVLAATPNGQTLYAGTDSGVFAISTATKTAVAQIPFGSSVYAIAVTPDGQTLYVGSGSTVTPVNTATNTAGAPIAMGAGTRQQGMAVTPDGKTVYVSNYGAGTVTPIDAATNTAGAPIAVGGQYAWAVAISPIGKKLYVSDYFANTVTPIDTVTNTAGAPVAVGAFPFAIAFTPAGGTAYLSSYGTNTIKPIKTATNVVGPPISSALIAGPAGIAFVPDQAPVAAFTATTAPVGQATSFDASASLAPGAPIAKYVWRFGDGTNATTTTPTVTHVYTTAGRLNVTLTLTDTAGTSTTTLFTGQTMSRAGSPTAGIKVQITVPS